LYCLSICTVPYSLNKKNKKLKIKINGKKPSGEQQRRIRYMSCDQNEALQSYINTFNEYDRMDE